MGCKLGSHLNFIWALSFFLRLGNMKEVTFNEQNEIETHTEIRRPANRTSNFYKTFYGKTIGRRASNNNNTSRNYWEFIYI